MANETAVVLSCHGTVEKVEDIPAFVQNIRRGRPAPDEVIHEVTERFEEIGGSPLMRISHAQAAALEARLGLPCRAAARLWHPYPSEVLKALHAEGIRRVVSLPLAPQSVQIYNKVVVEAAAELGIEVVEAPSYGEEPSLVHAFADAIVDAHGQFDDTSKLALVLSAHSLPTRVIAMGDPYEDQFRAMANAVVAELDRREVHRAETRIAFQSQGMGGGDWIGPDLDETFARLREAGVERLLMAPIGFVAEHVETLYDIDIEAKENATKLGFNQLVRMRPMDTRDGFIDTLETVARRLL
ncbi:MAG: ferrochelatase [Myxococcota bacterium]